MNNTSVITCPNCKRQLTLFGEQIKARKGYIRCSGCGMRIHYDLTRRGGGSGFWPKREIPFQFHRD